MHGNRGEKAAPARIQRALLVDPDTWFVLFYQDARGEPRVQIPGRMGIAVIRTSSLSDPSRRAWQDESYDVDRVSPFVVPDTIFADDVVRRRSHRSEVGNVLRRIPQCPERTQG